jgi:DNA-binding LacI/PurR family transcriptional regulator
VLFADESQSGLTHDYFSNVLDSFKLAAEEKGYDITFINCSKTGTSRMSYLEHTQYRGLDGVVIACIDFSDPQVVELINSKIPVVTIDHVFDNATAIVSDNSTGMHDLVQFVLDKGHSRIAYIHGADSTVTKNRLTAFYRTTEEAGISIPDDYVREAAYRDVEEAYERTRELLELPEPPTCILYPDDVSGFGGIKAIKEAGYVIPGDISIAGYDGVTFGQYLTPPLTTLQQDAETIGRDAAEELIQMIENPKTTGIRRVVVGGQVTPGGTVKNLLP